MERTFAPRNLWTVSNGRQCSGNERASRNCTMNGASGGRQYIDTLQMLTFNFSLSLCRIASMEAIHSIGSPSRKARSRRTHSTYTCQCVPAFSPLRSSRPPTCFREVPPTLARGPVGYARRRAMADLVIVESPGKTGKINQLLGAGYVVRGRRQAARWHASDGPRRRRAASARARGYAGRLGAAAGDRGDAGADLAQGRR